MPVLIQQSSTGTPLLFLLVLQSDHISPATGLGGTPTVTLSKNGAAFAAPAGAISEISNGFYQVAGNATDTATFGPLYLHATGTGTDPTDLVVAQIVGFDPTQGAFGGSVNVQQWNGAPVATPNIPGVPLVDVADWLGAAVSAATAGIPNVNVARFNNVVAVNLPANFTLMNIDGSGNVAVQSNVKKNQASAGFMFVMTNSTTHQPMAGLGSTVTSQRSIDAGPINPTVNTVTEVGLGIYRLDLAGGDMSGNHVMFEFTAANADTRCIELITDP